MSMLLTRLCWKTTRNNPSILGPAVCVEQYSYSLFSLIKPCLSIRINALAPIIVVPLWAADCTISWQYDYVNNKPNSLLIFSVCPDIWWCLRVSPQWQWWDSFCTVGTVEFLYFLPLSGSWAPGSSKAQNMSVLRCFKTPNSRGRGVEGGGGGGGGGEEEEEGIKERRREMGGG